MNILLTNDDGIYAPGIQALMKTLKPLGQVTVVAPEHERSSVSHGITLFQPLWCKKIALGKKLSGYAISGTPADCVKFGVKMILKKKPDLVVSGINLGENDGCSVFYSGTVAAAREAALLGIPALAVSLATFHDPDFRYTANLTAKLARFLEENPLRKGTFLNVNVPHRPAAQIKGTLLTRQGMAPIHTQFRKRYNPLDKEYFWMTGKNPVTAKNLKFDTTALAQGYVVVTPLHCDLTDEKTLKEFPQNLNF